MSVDTWPYIPRTEKRVARFSCGDNRDDEGSPSAPPTLLTSYDHMHDEDGLVEVFLDEGRAGEQAEGDREVHAISLVWLAGRFQLESQHDQPPHPVPRRIPQSPLPTRLVRGRHEVRHGIRRRVAGLLPPRDKKIVVQGEG